jgi:predicted nucleic acid-binding protein
MRFVDANIFIRFLAADDERKTEACLRFFRRIQTGAESVTTSEATIAEVVYVLSSRSLYGLSNEDIAARLTLIISLRGLQLRYKRACLRAFDLFGAHPFLDFEDALAVAHMERLGISEIVSYDRDFDRVSGVKRVEP